VRTALESHDRLYELLEVVMDLGRPPLARFPSGDLRLSDNLVTAEDLEQAVAKVRAPARVRVCRPARGRAGARACAPLKGERDCVFVCFSCMCDVY
jgi:hypothetical protein